MTGRTSGPRVAERVVEEQRRRGMLTLLRPWIRRMSCRGLSPLQVLCLRTAVAGILVGLWQYEADSNPIIVGAPIPVVKRVWLWIKDGTLESALRVTLTEVVVGFLIAAILGVILGWLIVQFRVIDAATRPFIDVINAIPRIALAPILILIVGFGEESKIVLVVTVVTFIVLINVQTGLESVEQEHIMLVRSLGGNRRDVARLVLLPSLMPWLIASLRLGGAYAIAAAVVGEFIGASQGLGFLLAYHSTTLDPTGAFAALFALVVVAWAVTASTMAIERRVLAWRFAQKVGARTSRARSVE